MVQSDSELSGELTRYVNMTIADETPQGVVETAYYAPIDLVRAKFDGFLTNLEREIAGSSREVQLFYGMLTPLLIPLFGMASRMLPKMGFPPLPKRERGQDPFFVMMRYVSNLVSEYLVRMDWTLHADADGVFYDITSVAQPCEDCPDSSTPFLAERLESESATAN